MSPSFRPLMAAGHRVSGKEDRLLLQQSYDNAEDICKVLGPLRALKQRLG